MLEYMFYPSGNYIDRICCKLKYINLYSIVIVKTIRKCDQWKDFDPFPLFVHRLETQNELLETTKQVFPVDILGGQTTSGGLYFLLQGILQKLEGSAPKCPPGIWTCDEPATEEGLQEVFDSLIDIYNVYGARCPPGIWTCDEANLSVYDTIQSLLSIYIEALVKRCPPGIWTC